jgi:hypothetical protein
LLLSCFFPIYCLQLIGFSHTRHKPIYSHDFPMRYSHSFSHPSACSEQNASDMHLSWGYLCFSSASQARTAYHPANKRRICRHAASVSPSSFGPKGHNGYHYIKSHACPSSWTHFSFRSRNLFFLASPPITMYADSGYRSLPGGLPSSSVSDEEKEEDTIECPLCARIHRERWYHWSAHVISIAAVLYLLFLRFDPSHLAATCWDLHNYYCKIIYHTPSGDPSRPSHHN